MNALWVDWPEQQKDLGAFRVVGRTQGSEGLAVAGDETKRWATQIWMAGQQK